MNITGPVEIPVDLLTTECSNCGLVLGLSEDHIGAVIGEERLVLVWHAECAPNALRRAHAERVVDCG